MPPLSILYRLVCCLFGLISDQEPRDSHGHREPHLGAPVLTSPPAAPQANALCERMIETLRRELLDKILIVTERSGNSHRPRPDPHQ